MSLVSSIPYKPACVFLWARMCLNFLFFARILVYVYTGFFCCLTGSTTAASVRPYVVVVRPVRFPRTSASTESRTAGAAACMLVLTSTGAQRQAGACVRPPTQLASTPRCGGTWTRRHGCEREPRVMDMSGLNHAYLDAVCQPTRYISGASARLRLR